MIDITNPLAWWKFDEGTGTSAGDATGNGHTMTLTGGAFWSAGKFGTCVYLPGTGGSASAALDLSGTAVLTVSFWAYLGGSLLDIPLIELALSTAHLAGSFGIVANWDGFNSLVSLVADSGMSGVYEEKSFTKPSEGAWHHWGVVLDRTQAFGAKIVAVYIDGVAVTLATQLSDIVTGNFANSTLYLFGEGHGPSINDLLIDDLRVYNRILSAAEIAILASSTSSADIYSRLAAWYKLNDGAGLTAIDSAGTFDASPHGGASWGSGSSGGGLMLDGNNGYARTGNIFTTSKTAFTLTFWGYRATSGDMLMVGDGGVLGQRKNILVMASGHIRWQCEAGGTSYNNSVFSGVGWHHFAMVYDGSQATNANRVAGYVDGVLQSVATVGTLPASVTFSNAIEIGRQFSSGEYALGSFDEVRVYDRALAADAIAALAVAPTPTFSVDPTISGFGYQGYILTCDGGTIDIGTKAYQWYSATDGSGTGIAAISGETALAYVVATGLGGKFITCKVTATNGTFGSTTHQATSYIQILSPATYTPDGAVLTFGDPTGFVSKFIIADHTVSDSATQVMPDPVAWDTGTPQSTIDWSAHAVAVDVIGRTRANEAGATLIAPSFAIVASHEPGTGTGYEWTTPGGTKVTRTCSLVEGSTKWNIVGQVGNSRDGDLTVIKLNSPVTGITPTQILVNSSNAAGKTALAIEEDRHLSPQTVDGGLNNGEYLLYYTSPTADILESGDSGHALTLLVNGKMVFLGAFSTAATCPNPSHYLNELAAIVATNSETLTVTGGGVNHTIAPYHRLLTAKSGCGVNL